MGKSNALYQDEQRKRLWCCCGCGEPAGLDGNPDCDCVTGILFIPTDRGSSIPNARSYDREIERIEQQVESLRAEKAEMVARIVARIEQIHEDEQA